MNWLGSIFLCKLAQFATYLIAIVFGTRARPAFTLVTKIRQEITGTTRTETSAGGTVVVLGI